MKLNQAEMGKRCFWFFYEPLGDVHIKWVTDSLYLSWNKLIYLQSLNSRHTIVNLLTFFECDKTVSEGLDQNLSVAFY